MAWTAGVGRSHFSHRAGVVFDDAGALCEGLRALVGTEERPEPREATKVAFVYADEAGRWAGMGEALYENEPVARTVLDRCDALMRETHGASLLDVMFGRGDGAGDLDDLAWTQPAIYALECALTALWSSVGIRPGVVAGYGVGEIAAAQAAGVFDLEAGLRLASARGALAGTVPEAGTLPEAGTRSASLDDLDAALEGVALAPPSRTFLSAAAGRAMEPGEAFDAAYWRRQAGEPGAFEPRVATLAEAGVDVVIEIGPSSALGSMIARTWPASEGSAGAGGTDASAPVVISSLQRPRLETEPEMEPQAEQRGGDFPEAAARAYEAGLAVSFAGLFAGESRRRVSLPGYPFQRRRHWVKTRDRQLASSPP